MNDALDLAIMDTGTHGKLIVHARRNSDLAVVRIDSPAQLNDLFAFSERLDQCIRGLEKRPSSRELADFGRGLFSLVIRDRVRELYDRLPVSTHVRLRIFGHGGIQALPWEYFQEPQRTGPCRERSVARIVDTVGRDDPAPLKLSQKVRVLFVSADPVDQLPVPWADVKSRIETVFYSRAQDCLILESVDAADAESVRKALVKGAFDILHFCGHGEVDQDGKGCLLFYNRTTQTSTPYPAERFASLLSGTNVQLVILSACYTAAGNFRDDFAVTADALVRAGVPAVVANQLPVQDKTVAVFVGALYEKLLLSGDIDLAVNEGRMSLLASLAVKPGDSVLECGIPVVYRHIGASTLFEP